MIIRRFGEERAVNGPKVVARRTTPSKLAADPVYLCTASLCPLLREDRPAQSGVARPYGVHRHQEPPFRRRDHRAGATVEAADGGGGGCAAR